MPGRRRGRGESMQQTNASLRASRDAHKRHAWPEAYELLATADASGGLSPEDLESLAEAAWCTAHFQNCLDAYERAYAQHLEQGNRSRAAFIALWLALLYSSRRAASVAAGWRSRAERFLNEEPECCEHGFLAWAHTRAALAEGDLDRAFEHATKAFEIGKRYSNRDLQGLGLLDKGLVLLRKGDIADGRVLLDEAMAAAMGGELSPQVTRLIYCDGINACQSLADYRRAAEWVEVWERECEREQAAGFSGDCRVHRAQILRLRGAWVKAEQEARRACDEFRTWNIGLGHAGAASYEIGEIRLCEGNLAAAEDAFLQANQFGHDAQPGLARLRLAEGKVEAAATSIKHALAAQPLSRLARARRLPAQVEIAIAAGDHRPLGYRGIGGHRQDLWDRSTRGKRGLRTRRARVSGA